MNKLFSSDPAIQMKLYIVETTCVFLYKMAMAFWVRGRKPTDDYPVVCLFLLKLMDMNLPFPL